LAHCFFSSPRSGRFYMVEF